MVETRTIIESLYYLLKNIGPSDKIKLVKLLYFADKYHLIKYGRTITNDDYWAMDHGPVGSIVKDVLEQDELTMSENESSVANALIHRIGKTKFKALKSAQVENFEFLSETDIEALDFVINNFGEMGTWDIRDYSHRYPEWAQYKDLFENHQTKREKILTEELFSVVKGDPYKFTDEQISEAKNHFLGVYE